MTDLVLETVDLAFTYPDGTHALKGINMDIKKGEKVAVMGANGQGNLHYFHILMG